MNRIWLLQPGISPGSRPAAHAYDRYVVKQVVVMVYRRKEDDRLLVG